MKRFLVSLFFLLIPLSALACPFCDFGSSDAAYFIITVFGAFVLGMTFLWFIYRRAIKNEKNDRIESAKFRVLEAEGINDYERKTK